MLGSEAGNMLGRIITMVHYNTCDTEDIKEFQPPRLSSGSSAPEETMVTGSAFRINKTTGTFLLFFVVAVSNSVAGTQIVVTPENWLDELATARLPSGTLIPGHEFQLVPGDYHLTPQAYQDSTCGNCEDPLTEVMATVGLILSGRHLVIRGMGATADDVVIHTRAGYGLLFTNCRDCRISGLTITDGFRDADPNATDAAIVVRNSEVCLENCVIRDNLGDSTAVARTVVGIMGIVGREGADLIIQNNHLLRNSWDGIALYRGAQALIVDNIIDGVDLATGGRHGGGRGVGIGVTWDAKATVRGNRVTRYWKGIGIFVDAEATVQDNVIEDIATWGIAYWGAGRGRPVAHISSNVIFDTGACGIAITRELGGLPEPGYCRENIIVRTGQNPKYDSADTYCEQCPLAIQARPASFVVADNLLYQNRRGRGVAGSADLGETDFRVRAQPLLARLAAQPALRASQCFQAIAALCDTVEPK